ncbi:hypothetical protein FKM82_016484 [Ascaphus truei]
MAEHKNIELRHLLGIYICSQSPISASSYEKSNRGIVLILSIHYPLHIGSQLCTKFKRMEAQTLHDGCFKHLLWCETQRRVCSSLLSMYNKIYIFCTDWDLISLSSALPPLVSTWHLHFRGQITLWRSLLSGCGLRLKVNQTCFYVVGVLLKHKYC